MFTVISSEATNVVTAWPRNADLDLVTVKEHPLPCHAATVDTTVASVGSSVPSQRLIEISTGTRTHSQLPLSLSLSALSLYHKGNSSSMSLAPSLARSLARSHHR